MGIGYNPRIVTQNLSIYLDANNIKSYTGSGTAWNDLSGNNRNFTWVSAPTLNAENQKSFTTLNNRCTGPASNSVGITNTSGYTIFLLVKQNNIVGASAFKFYSSVAGGRGIFSHCVWGDGNVYFDQGGCCNADTRTFVNAGTVTNWNMFAFSRQTNGSIRKIYKNGNLLTTQSNTAADLNLSATGIDLGSSDEYGGNTSAWDARLGGFLVYNRELAEAEIQQNFNALRGRFGI